MLAAAKIIYNMIRGELRRWLHVMYRVDLSAEKGE
jgi:hypothetical protein